MGYKFNPFTGNLDTVDSPNGVFEEIDVNGDITLDDGGTFTTTLQTVTATANRTISFPDATGTVALVAGSSGQLVYNNAGANAGVPSSVIGATGDVTLALNGAASTPPLDVTGTWFTGGTSTTTKPQVLIEPAGTTSTAWSTSGTGIGVNAASGFTGSLLDLQTNGTSRAVVTGAGNVGIGTTSPASELHVQGTLSGGQLLVATNQTNATAKFGTLGTVHYTNNEEPALSIGALSSSTDNEVLIGGGLGEFNAATTIRFSTAANNTTTTGTERVRIDSSGRLGLGTNSPSSLLHLADAGNITVGTTTGTKIGTATTQKLGFFGADPVVQQTELTDELTTITHTAPGTADFAIQNLSLTGYGFVTEDEGNTVLSVIANLQARVNELETKLVALGFLADAD